MSWQQESLFATAMKPIPIVAEGVEARDPDGLRPYQRECVDAVFASLEKVQCVLFVLPTGAGKTRTAGAIVRRFRVETKGRVLWLAESDFLLDDARKRLVQMTGEMPALEKASFRADGSSIVVGSVQSLRGARLTSWRPDHFGLIVYDEAKHAVSPRARAIFDHFSSAKVVGMDATPQRLDKIGMHNVFQSVAFERYMPWAIAEGYFVPPLPVARFIKDIDLSHVGTVAGDLKLSDLEIEIARNAAAIAKIAFRDCGERQTLVYTPGRASAHAVAATLNELRAGCAVSVDQDTPKPERDGVLSAFNRRETQYIVNCQIYREGLDVPGCSAIVIARLTQSKSLYEQMMGRGGRPEAGIGELATAGERLTAIARSSKPNFLLLDITGKPGKHRIVTPLDVLAGKHVPPDVLERAKKIAEAEPQKPHDPSVFALAAQELADEDKQRREAIAKIAAEAKVKTRKKIFDPFRKLGIDLLAESGLTPEWNAEPPTADDKLWLLHNKIDAKDLTRAMVAALRRQASKWKASGRATFRQRAALRRMGYPHDVAFTQASDMLAEHSKFGKNYWKRLTAMQLETILGRERQPGEEG